ncbi:hypothetical protein BVRB_6g156200 [Beta vulgaris subsp. vulgaris]|uniref:Uncharacterized protein n=1 Tax=Beta vulgaris subsp. vulgaris TaxID=3555 RepID=A0A0J8BBD5_BETVV|nr:hypothetical protein BVRB_6g156200 [Beta vulgaris subsp. vulgaris]
MFNWSKYQVKTSLTTKWTRKDIMDGRPLDITVTAGSNSEELTEKEKELDEEKNKHKVQLEELERKKEEELKEKQDEVDNLKHKLAEAELKNQEGLKKKQDEIAELKRKHNEDLTNLEQSNREQLKKKQDELERGKKENEDLEKVLKIYAFDRSDQPVPLIFFSRMVQYMQTDLPSSKITIRFTRSGEQFKWPPSVKIVIPLCPVETVTRYYPTIYNCVTT